jgi:DNA-binding transcriptional MerR regulator
MSEKTTRVDDIVRATGISEEEVRRYLKEYDSLLEYRKVGKARLYASSVIGAVEEIAALSAAGVPGDEITARISSDGGRQRSARREAAPRQAPAAPAAPPPARISRHAESPAPEVRQSSLVDMVAVLEQRVKKLQGRVESLEISFDRARKRHEEECAELEHALEVRDRQLRIVDEWIMFFEERLDTFEARDAIFAASTAEWIGYIDAAIDELSLSAAERIRRRLG